MLLERLPALIILITYFINIVEEGRKGQLNVSLRCRAILMHRCFSVFIAVIKRSDIKLGRTIDEL